MRDEDRTGVDRSTSASVDGRLSLTLKKIAHLRPPFVCLLIALLQRQILCGGAFLVRHRTVIAPVVIASCCCRCRRCRRGRRYRCHRDRKRRRDAKTRGARGFPRRMHGLEENVEVCIFYVESWLRGNGCIPVNHKMEDAATAEISRAQVPEGVRRSLLHTAISCRVYEEINGG